MNRTDKRSYIHKNIGIFVTSFLLALLISLGIISVTAAFFGPTAGPPADTPDLPINVSGLYQEKDATIIADDFFVNERKRWLSQGPAIIILQKLGPKGGDGKIPAGDQAITLKDYCPSGFKLLSCYGNAITDLNGGFPLDDAGLIGIIPLNSNGDAAVDTDGDGIIEDAIGCGITVDTSLPPVFTWPTLYTQCTGFIDSTRFGGS